MKKIYFLLIIFISATNIIHAEESFNRTAYYSAPYGDYEMINVTTAEVYNVISNPDPALRYLSGSNFTNDFRFVNFNKGMRVFGECVGDYVGTTNVDANNPTASYIELNAETAEIFFKQDSQIRCKDDTHRILFRSSENKLELREAGDIIFSSGAVSGSETATMVLEASGDVGIGTGAPQVNLEVASSANVISGMRYAGQVRLTHTSPQLDFIDSDNNDWSIHVNSNTMYFVRQPWIFTDLVLKDNGNVGIGTSSPQYTLDVDGSINLTGVYEDGVKMGTLAKCKIDGDNNLFLLDYLDRHLIDGSGNTVFGCDDTFVNIQHGTYNCAAGSGAMKDTKKRSSATIHNVAFGDDTLDSRQPGNYNVAIGHGALGSGGSDSSGYVAMNKNVELIDGWTSKTGNGNVYIDARRGWATATMTNKLYIRTYVRSANNQYCRDVIVADFSANTVEVDNLTKEGGFFQITHPDPMKGEQGWLLNHAFVESPTAGDNLYRFRVETKNRVAKIKLPGYFKYLNENIQIWISPEGHFGRAYGKIDRRKRKIIIKTNKDGVYNVLVFGTRKDKAAKAAWKRYGGVETIS